MTDPARIKLIASDLDGTLLGADGELDPRSAAAFRAAVGAGLRVCLCTGRHWTGARTFARAVDPDMPVVSVNGALVRTEARVLRSQALDRGFAAEVLGVLDSLGLYAHLYVDDYVLSRREELCMDYYARFNARLERADRFELRYRDDLVAALPKGRAGPGEGIFKIVCIARDGELAAMEEARVRVSELGGATISCSDSGSFEVFAEGLSKAEGLVPVLEELGIGFEEVIALGDQSNDEEMLSRAGIAVAMGNAAPALKAVADIVAPRNTELGAARAIAALGLAGGWAP